MRGSMWGALALLLAGTACEPTCKRTCRSLIACDLQSDRVTLDECEAACVFQERQYEDAEQDALRDRLAEHKRCVNRESCDDLAAGVCYDPDVFSFSQVGPQE